MTKEIYEVVMKVIDDIVDDIRLVATQEAQTFNTEGLVAGLELADKIIEQHAESIIDDYKYINNIKN